MKDRRGSLFDVPTLGVCECHQFENLPTMLFKVARKRTRDQAAHGFGIPPFRCRQKFAIP
ncbi:MAG: hypothetical protein H0X01_09240 [Nitrospira sp.]|nr:hypothetical protein [Nitrospira sp.]